MFGLLPQYRKWTNWSLRHYQLCNFSHLHNCTAAFHTCYKAFSCMMLLRLHRALCHSLIASSKLSFHQETGYWLECCIKWKLSNHPLHPVQVILHKQWMKAVGACLSYHHQYPAPRDPSPLMVPIEEKSLSSRSQSTEYSNLTLSATSCTFRVKYNIYPSATSYTKHMKKFP